MSTLYCAALGIGTRNADGEWLEVLYPAPQLTPSSAIEEALHAALGPHDGNRTVELDDAALHAVAAALRERGEDELAAQADALLDSEMPVLACILTADLPPANVAEAFLKLQLISHRLVRPHGTRLDGIFGVLKNLAWTSEGAIDLADLPQRRLAARRAGRTLQVDCVDKFPKMTDYVVPSGVRIADTARVRLGAYIGEGTTVMHEGFVNFNAGTAGPNMIEGRVSAGVFVESGSDLGGGCSTMGTLSGGGNIVISIGRECLIGANAGVGIPLGDRCTIEAGLYVTASTKVTVLDDAGNPVEVIKASSLANKSDLLFRRNSLSGAVECLTNRSAIQLNEELHAHN